MTKQGVNLTILDGQLGQQPPGQGQTEVVVGVSSGGTVPNYTPYTTSNPQTMQTNSGNGPAIRLAAFIATGSGNPVTVCTIPANAAGTLVNGGVCYAGTSNTGTSTFTLTGTPLDDYYLVFTPLVGVASIASAGGVLGISLDGGATNAYTVNLNGSSTVTTGSAFTTYTGLTLTIGAGSLVANDVFYNVATAPTYSDANVQSAINSVVAIKSQAFQDIIVAGVTGASDATAFDGYMATLATTNKRFSRLLCSARDAAWGGASTESQAVWQTSIITAFGNNSTPRVAVCAGYYRFIDPFTSSQMRSSLLYGAAAIDAAVTPATDLGEVDLGAIQNLVLPAVADTFAKGTFFYHDEDTTPGLDAARFLSAWQLVGVPGVFVMNPNLMAEPGSDFNWLQHGHVVDEACATVYAFFIKKLSKPVRVNPKTGFILEQDRQSLQNGCNSALGTALVGQTSAIIVQVSPSDNILSTSTLTVNAYVVPLAYLKAVNGSVALFNPANAVNSQAFNATGIAA